MAQGERFLIGSVGQQYILSALSSSSQPFKVIEEFQKTHGVHLKEVSIGLPLLDLHQVPRKVVYESLLGKMREHLLSKLPSMTEEKKLGLLEEAFPYMAIAELRQVPMTLLEQLGAAVPSKYLNAIAANRTLYECCPMDVKRNVWRTQEPLFRERVLPLFSAYATVGELASPIQEMNYDESAPVRPRARRQKSEPLQALLSLMGDSLPLYNRLLHMCRVLYAATGNALFCNLRMDLLMALHDANRLEIPSCDPCYKFCWILDACVDDNSVNTQRMSELQPTLEEQRTGDPVLGDLGMVVASPAVSHMLVRNIFAQLDQAVQMSLLPEQDEMLLPLTKVLAVGMQARAALQQQKFTRPEEPTAIIKVFYQLLAIHIADDALSEEGGQREQLGASFTQWFQTSAVARKITLYYFLTRIRAKDHQRVQQLIGLFVLSDAGQIFNEEPAFVQSLITALIPIQELRNVVYDNFLLLFKDASLHVQRQLVRYLAEAWQQIPLRDLAGYLHRLLLPPPNPATRDVFELLLQRAGDRLTPATVPLLFDFLARPAAGMFPPPPPGFAFGPPGGPPPGFAYGGGASPPRQEDLHDSDDDMSPSMPAHPYPPQPYHHPHPQQEEDDDDDEGMQHTP